MTLSQWCVSSATEEGQPPALSTLTLRGVAPVALVRLQGSGYHTLSRQEVSRVSSSGYLPIRSISGAEITEIKYRLKSRDKEAAALSNEDKLTAADVLGGQHGQTSVSSRREGKKVNAVPAGSLSLLSLCPLMKALRAEAILLNGTYIRTLIDDLARAVRTLGVMTDLVRYESLRPRAHRRLYQSSGRRPRAAI